jgi:small subunit ribosomal protein S8
MLTVMKREGFIEDVKLVEAQPRNMLQVTLRYSEAGRVPVIHGIKRVSRPSLRVYADGTTMRSVRSGLGITILTTSKGVMSSKEARRHNVGGEVLCEVW